jgi:hypothetical protein
MDLKNYKIKKSKITNERQVLIRDFLGRLNQERKAPYKPLTPARVGMLLRYCTTSQLKTLWGELNYAKSFSKMFWWKLKK